MTSYWRRTELTTKSGKMGEKLFTFIAANASKVLIDHRDDASYHTTYGQFTKEQKLGLFYELYKLLKPHGINIDRAFNHWIKKSKAFKKIEENTTHSDGNTSISDSSVDNFNSSLTDDSFADSFRSCNQKEEIYEQQASQKIKLPSVTTHSSDEDAGYVIDGPQDQVRKPTPLKRRAINDYEPNNSRKATRTTRSSSKKKRFTKLL
ncbi:hypothetical protein BCR42DRAFT_398867 [Absidia repens]|uniref:Uncharacterized protein n=1 Tax=Absidia repens TaxID=90262 RepID=A0A1X2HR50_9FUNG|nr:hypothetical protein BCR42DRAFT_398867 [Absidia repens]